MVYYKNRKLEKYRKIENDLEHRLLEMTFDGSNSMKSSKNIPSFMIPIEEIEFVSKIVS